MHPLHRPAAIAPGDSQRVAILRSLGLLDSPSEECYDRITQSACDIFNVPIALVSLVDKDRQVSLQATDARAHALSLHTRRVCEVQTAALQSVLRVLSDLRARARATVPVVQVQGGNSFSLWTLMPCSPSWTHSSKLTS